MTPLRDIPFEVLPPLTDDMREDALRIASEAGIECELRGDCLLVADKYVTCRAVLDDMSGVLL